MILADTTVAIEFLRTPTPRLLKIIQDNNAAICGVTVAETYAGAKGAADFARYMAALSVFRNVAIPETTWDALGRNLYSLRRSGITVPFADALLATLAIESDLELWTHDAHFATIQRALTKLKLFVEPP